MPIYISSDGVFDGEKGGYSESDPTYPISYYGKTKLEAENIIRRSNHCWFILRPNVLYGNNLNSNASFVSWVVNSLSAKKEKVGEKAYESMVKAVDKVLGNNKKVNRYIQKKFSKESIDLVDAEIKSPLISFIPSDATTVQ